MAILGIDEVGRGPLAGPLVVGAVILPEYDRKNPPQWIRQLDDSKKLSFAKRELLSELIVKNAPACGLGWVMIEELNEIGLMEGLKLATKRAVQNAKKRHAKFSQIIIDGNVNFLEDTTLGPYVTTMIKGDSRVKEISAASIIAKVARDRYMIELSDTYPGYGFERHMGYGTKQHLAAIREIGVCSEHRLFCRPVANAVGVKKLKFRDEIDIDTTKIGREGEKKVVKYLEGNGHDILVQNWRAKTCEIDIISICGRGIYFTEVKTRKNDNYGGGAAAITLKKVDKMRHGMEVFLSLHPECKEYDPYLAAGIVKNGRVVDWYIID